MTLETEKQHVIIPITHIPQHTVVNTPGTIIYIQKVSITKVYTRHVIYILHVANLTESLNMLGLHTI